MKGGREGDKEGRGREGGEGGVVQWKGQERTESTS